MNHQQTLTHLKSLQKNYEIDKSMKLLQERLNNAIDNIANDKEVEIMF